MLGSVDQDETLSSCDWYGRETECELCGECRTCIEAWDLLTCRDCQRSLLPVRGIL